MVLKRTEECELGETGDDNDETKALKAKYKVLNRFTRRRYVASLCSVFVWVLGRGLSRSHDSWILFSVVLLIIS